MEAELKYLHSPDVQDLTNFQPPAEDFCIFIEMEVGPKGEKGQELFGIDVCTPQYLLRKCDEGEVILGRHYVIVFEYNFHRIENSLRKFVSLCKGNTWDEVALKVSRIGHWEFEDYVE